MSSNERRSMEQQRIALADRLVKATSGNRNAHALAVQLRKLLEPAPTIQEIIAMVPGNSDAERADRIGATRQAVSLWVRGKTRPAGVYARTLSKLTGVPLDIIRGRR